MDNIGEEPGQKICWSMKMIIDPNFICKTSNPVLPEEEVPEVSCEALVWNSVETVFKAYKVRKKSLSKLMKNRDSISN